MLAIRGGPLPVRNWILKVRESIAIRLRLIASFDLHADPGGRTWYKSWSGRFRGCDSDGACRRGGAVGEGRWKEDGSFSTFFSPFFFPFPPLSFFFLFFFATFPQRRPPFASVKKKKEKKNIKKRKREMEGWLMSETRHGISWQRGIFADKFFHFPGKVGKIVEDSFPFFLLYFISRSLC